MANGGLGALIAMANALLPSPVWFYLFTGVMATVTADTWATELGTLSKNPPRLITTGKPVAPGTSGGVKEISYAVRGEGVYGLLRWESGVHRVQRVPATESQGRIHTSAVTVAVLPEAEEIDVQIDENELRIDVFRASGPGGQSVNTTDSAVRITHLPSGLVVQCQDEKSQHKNKSKAMLVLRSRLLEQAIAAQDNERSAERRTLVGSGDRSAKIRTYNFPQSRFTDHRIGLTVHSLEAIMQGDLDEVVQAIQDHRRQEALADSRTDGA